MLVSLEDIAEDEELFAIPRSLVLDVQNSDLLAHITKEIDHLGVWHTLTLIIVYEYLKGIRSIWAPYFGVLPTTFDTLMFWSADELAELKGSAVLDKIGKPQAEMDFTDLIIPLMYQHPDLFPVSQYDDPTAKLKQLCHMAASLIMAYAFDLQSDDDSSDTDREGEDGYVSDSSEDDRNAGKGMVPFADMLNADADKNNVRKYLIF